MVIGAVVSAGVISSCRGVCIPYAQEGYVEVAYITRDAIPKFHFYQRINIYCVFINKYNTWTLQYIFKTNVFIDL